MRMQDGLRAFADAPSRIRLSFLRLIDLFFNLENLTC